MSAKNRAVDAGLALALALALSAATARAQEVTATRVYREINGEALKAFVFVPEPRSGGDGAAAILLFHGGGWYSGSPEWTFETAQRFAGLGLVAIAVEYRLSEGEVTPIEALADACAAFPWVRRNAGEFGIDPHRVAGYGVSAGGHLVAAVATVGCPEEDPEWSAMPDALLLWSPALDVTTDGWFARLLQDRAPSIDYSPAQHVKSGTPPTSIVHGDKDTLTPLAGARQFCSRLEEQRTVCELHVYRDVGHLLTRNLANQESDFDPDPEARADGIARQERFLAELGFVDAERRLAPRLRLRWKS